MNTAPAAAALEVTNLRVWFATPELPVRAVDGVSLRIERGEIVGLVGESGCGKSTLGRGILRLLPSTATVDGHVSCAGIDVLALPPRALQRFRGSGAGLIFQEPMTRLNPLMRIEDHFIETLNAHEPRLSRREARRRTAEILGAVGIPRTRLKQYPHEFSGGMRQRIMIALALVLRPALLIADEPTTALDVIVEAQICKLLRDLAQSTGTAILFITHNLGIVGTFCDRVAVMYAGQIIEEGPVRKVVGAPEHPYTQGLLKSTIDLDTTALHSIPGVPPDLTIPPPGCRFRPRCPAAMAVCHRPPLEQLRRDRRVSCWLYEPTLAPEDRVALPDVAAMQES